MVFFIISKQMQAYTYISQRVMATFFKIRTYSSFILFLPLLKAM